MNNFLRYVGAAIFLVVAIAAMITFYSFMFIAMVAIMGVAAVVVLFGLIFVAIDNWRFNRRVAAKRKSGRGPQ